MLEYDGQEIQTAVTRKVNKDISDSDCWVSIPCGTPEYEEEHIEGYVALPTAIFERRDLYILRANGESMIDAGIDDGGFSCW